MSGYVKNKRRENPYVQLDKRCLEDEKLSWKAKGLLAYVLSKPTDWTIRRSDLVKKSKDGKDAVSSAIKELEINGYVYRYQERDEKGQFGEWVWEVYELPSENPYFQKGEISPKLAKKLGAEPKTENPVAEPKTENPPSENPASEKPPYSNNDFSNNDFSNNKNLNLNQNDANQLNLPMAVKKYIYQKNLFGYGHGEGIYNSLHPLEIEKFYNSNMYIKETADKFDGDFINGYEFGLIVKAIVEKGPRPVQNTIGILKDYTLNYLTFKKDNQEYLQIATQEPKPEDKEE
jgi:hypothetical protein